jgi:ornithine carbamoyltransferase
LMFSKRSTRTRVASETSVKLLGESPRTAAFFAYDRGERMREQGSERELAG